MVVLLHGDGGLAAKCKMQQPPHAPALTELFLCTPFNQGFSNVWAPDHQLVSDDQLHVSLILDHTSGTGFKTKSAYVHGFFSAAIKLPANEYTAGVITTFYTSNEELYPDQHDEVDFEFLGRASGEEYILQTNVYINGSINTGREQRLRLWFDPTADYHDYSILWTSKHIVMYIDDLPIREFSKVGELARQYPAKQMYAYGTIWDGSDWATDGGKYKANYTYAPFEAQYTDFILNGCRAPTSWATTMSSSTTLDCDCEFSLIPEKLSRHQRRSISWVQQNYMTYNYCDDTQRYPTSLPECPPPIKDEL